METSVIDRGDLWFNFSSLVLFPTPPHAPRGERFYKVGWRLVLVVVLVESSPVWGVLAR